MGTECSHSAVSAPDLWSFGIQRPQLQLPSGWMVSNVWYCRKTDIHKL